MIRVSVEGKKHIDKIKILGHADYEDYGKDIVCSSVSSIMTTTINAIFLVDKDSINYEDSNSKVTIKILKNSDITNKLITNMINMFKDLESDYPKNIPRSPPKRHLSASRGDICKIILIFVQIVCK